VVRRRGKGGVSFPGALRGHNRRGIAWSYTTGRGPRCVTLWPYSANRGAMPRLGLQIAEVTRGPTVDGPGVAGAVRLAERAAAGAELLVSPAVRDLVAGSALSLVAMGGHPAANEPGGSGGGNGEGAATAPPQRAADVRRRDSPLALVRR
jgi:hypothetical protein